MNFTFNGQDYYLKTDIDAVLKAITPKTKIIFIANPNNPTGSYLNKDEVEKLINGAPKNVLIVLGTIISLGFIASLIASSRVSKKLLD